MTLADTSVWVEHLRRGNQSLAELLHETAVVIHPFVIGELALGHLRRRDEILSMLGELPQAPEPSHDEVLDFVARHRLAGEGVGWVDAHLLAAAALGGVALWTLDRKLAATARRLGLSASA